MFVVAEASPRSLVDGVAFAVLSDVFSAPRVSCCRFSLRWSPSILSRRSRSRGVSMEIFPYEDFQENCS